MLHRQTTYYKSSFLAVITQIIFIYQRGLHLGHVKLKASWATYINWPAFTWSTTSHTTLMATAEHRICNSANSICLRGRNYTDGADDVQQMQIYNNMPEYVHELRDRNCPYMDFLRSNAVLTSMT